MKKLINKIEATDIFQFIGLSFLGIGLYFCAGIGVSLSVIGALLILIGFFAGAVKDK